MPAADVYATRASADTAAVEATGPAEPRSPGRLRRRAAHGKSVWVPRIAVIFVVLAAWELAVVLDPERAFWLSRPSAITADVVARAQTARFWLDVRTTVNEIVVGFSVGAFLGIAAGFVLGYYQRAFKVLEPIVFGLYSLPRVALVPLFILWFGIGLMSKVAIVISVVFFILLLNTYYGVQAIDRDLVNNVLTMGASKRFVFRTVAIPTCVVWILAGARICLSFSLMAAVMAEMVASRAGLGHALMRTSGAFDTTGTFSLLVVLGIFAVAINWAMERLQARLLRWQANPLSDRRTGW